MTDNPETPIRGGCLCGEVAFEVTPPAKFCIHCHCTMCRRANGAAFVTWVVMPEARVRMVAGEAALVRYQSSPGGSRSFCGKCGTQLFCQNDHHPGLIDVTRASLPDDAGFDPRSHIYYSDKAGWVEVNDGLRKLGGETGTEPLEDD